MTVISYEDIGLANPSMGPKVMAAITACERVGMPEAQIILSNIASYRTMERRIRGIRANGTAGEIEVFDGLSHGFGLGEGTVAEGWINRAVAFWEENTDQ